MKRRPSGIFLKQQKKKIPKEWGEPKANKKGVGKRWSDPKNKGNGIRIDQGNSNHDLESQRADHVIIRKEGKIIARNGKELSGKIKENAIDSHISLSEWVKWKNWHSPF